MSLAAAQGPAAAIRALEPLGGTLTSVTPVFRWTVSDTAALPRPVTHRLRVARDSTLRDPLVDTVLTDAEQYQLRRPVRPGAVLFWRVDATGSTGIQDSTGTVGPVRGPPWVTLTTLNHSAGTNITDPMPTFTWTSPGIAVPPGPFVYDLAVIEAATGATVARAADLTDTTARSPARLDANVAYAWSVVARAGGDSSGVRSAGTFLVLDPSLPPTTLLYQNFPNPFPTADREATCIWFDLATTGLVELEILDLRGNLVRRLIPGPDFAAILPAGRYGRGGPGEATCAPRLTWDGRAGDGRTVPRGVYLTKLKAAGQNFFRRMVFRGRR